MTLIFGIYFIFAFIITAKTAFNIFIAEEMDLWGEIDPFMVGAFFAISLLIGLLGIFIVPVYALWKFIIEEPVTRYVNRINSKNEGK